jgi:hypothetical protein
MAVATSAIASARCALAKTRVGIRVLRQNRMSPLECPAFARALSRLSSNAILTDPAKEPTG